MTSHATTLDPFHAREVRLSGSGKLTLVVALAGGAIGSVQANDFPTAERVEFVLECMRDYPGPEFEMMQKCSCVLDAIAETLTYDQYVAASTVAKAVTIAGERGSALRENQQVQDEARAFRTLFRDARKRCMFRP